MRDLLGKYMAKMVADGSASAERVAFAVRDDLPLGHGAPELERLALEILSRGNAVAVVLAEPQLPWSDFLVRRSPPGENRIIPRDTETRTFLHDIPFLRRDRLTKGGADEIAGLLSRRKGIIVEGLGIVASGALTVEQAYINYSSIAHAVFVKYLQDILNHGFLLEEEERSFSAFRNNWLHPLSAEGLPFRKGPLVDRQVILSEMAAVGRHTVLRRLVDSFFGNISVRCADTIYISQTAASLDELEGCIDPVPMDGSSTAGITASSELLAHRRIYEGSEARVILHGHPKFSVVMSMVCGEGDCAIVDCWRDCPRVRLLGDTPVVAGEVGAGGLALRMPPVIADSGKAIVYGHGLFTTGRDDFEEAFRTMVEVENWCRDEYFRLLQARLDK